MKQSTICTVLSSLGLSGNDIRVYALLEKTGAHQASEIADLLNLTEKQLHPCLKNLQGQGVLYATSEMPTKFYALPFEKVLEMLAHSRIDEAQNIRKNKNKLVLYWQRMIESDDYFE